LLDFNAYISPNRLGAHLKATTSIIAIPTYIDGLHASLTATATIAASPNVIDFLAYSYAYDNNQWKLVAPYVNYKGNWVSPLQSFVKDNGIWKRVA